MPLNEPLIAAIAGRVDRLSEPKDLSPLLDRLKSARIVMLGEATHGTADFYEWRRMISEWLIVKHGFNLIAVEGDWPDIAWIDRYVRRSEGESARTAMERIRRWPTWMWANTEIVRLAEWLHSHNQRLPREKRVGIHGLDLYSLFESIDSVLNYLESINPFLARRARLRYACFDPYRRDEIAYARAAHAIFNRSCQAEVVQNLQDLLKLRVERFQQDGFRLFDAQQNARIIQSAERYFRILIHGDNRSWNVRDRHMLDTLGHLLEYYGAPESRAIVWAHNSHIGDYRASEMLEDGLVNLGGLAREKYGKDTVAIVGFGAHRGKLIASRAWDGPIQALPLPPARPGSIEDAFHSVAETRGEARLLLVFTKSDAEASPLTERYGHRAIGVVYDPEHEGPGNYVPSALALRYDAFIHIENTEALRPLVLPFEKGELPETWPAGR